MFGLWRKFQTRKLRRLYRKYRERFPAFYQAFEETHAKLLKQGLGNKGHGIDHDLSVAQHCLLIQGDKRVARRAWIAALLHSFDRFFDDKAEEMIDGMLRLLPAGEFSNAELAEIKDAVLRHNKPNEPDDSPTLKTLKDADRLANLCAATLLIRSGQLNTDLLAVDMRYPGRERGPESNYQNPGSVVADAYYALEWTTLRGLTNKRVAVRLRKSKRIANKKGRYLLRLLDGIKEEFTMLGLYPPLN